MYVADEIVTAASGVRIRVNNTDAEGRFAMGDCLYYMKEEVQISRFETLNKHTRFEGFDNFLTSNDIGHQCT